MNGFVGNFKRKIIRKKQYADKLYDLVFLNVLLASMPNRFGISGCCFKYTSINSNCVLISINQYWLIGLLFSNDL